MQKFDHNIGFSEKRHFVLRKLSKIAENCDHNIDPSSAKLVGVVLRGFPLHLSVLLCHMHGIGPTFTIFWLLRFLNFSSCFECCLLMYYSSFCRMFNLNL
jgi:hypothetical protein